MKLSPFDWPYNEYIGMGVGCVDNNKRKYFGISYFYT